MRHFQARNPILNAPAANASPLNGASGDRVMAASVAERRVMKKVAQPEHAYTGCVPQREEPDIDDQPVKRNPPILGYKGHLRNAQDRIGTTFTNGLEAVTRPPDLVGLRTSNQKAFSVKQPYPDKKDHRQTRHQQVRFQAPPPQRKGHYSPNNRPANGNTKPQMSPRSKYGAFENASGYGEFQAKPQNSEKFGYGEFDNTSGYGEFQKPPTTSKRSGYGAFDNASGYGEFLAKPQVSGRSGYGEFENASGYGEFQANPQMSGRSGYGEFDNASGYGEFQAKPAAMSKRSGYGAFDNASGYGEFLAKPSQMSGRFGYGEFGNASGYGEFLVKPQMSPRSAYGAFDNASGYGEFQEAPPMSGRSGYGAFEDASGYGEFGAPPPPSDSIAYGAFEDASGYGEFMEAPQENQHGSSPIRDQQSKNPAGFVLKYSESLDRKYQQAIKAVGGKANALKLWHAAAATISCRHRKRTELLQSIRRSFEKREPENGGKMAKADLKEALQSLACVFTDDQVSEVVTLCTMCEDGNGMCNGVLSCLALYLDEQVTALFGLHDTHCKDCYRRSDDLGTVPMDTLLIALTDCL